jgi:thymidylate kinase
MKRPFLMSFSGMDGSGKTHLVILLRRFFRRQGISYIYIHSVRDSFANRIAKKIPSSENLTGPKGQKKVSAFSVAVRKVTLFLDALYLRLRVQYAWRSYDVVVFDRYIYDRLVQLAYLQGKKTLDSGLWLVEMFPRPNLPLYLHITPDQAIERKKEVVDEGQDLDYFYHKYQLFEEGKGLWKLFTIDNSSLGVSEAKKKMTSIFKKRFFRFKKINK